MVFCASLASGVRRGQAVDAVIEAVRRVTGIKATSGAARVSTARPARRAASCSTSPNSGSASRAAA